MLLTAVLTLLAAAYQTCRSDEVCPLQCVHSLVVATRNGPVWIHGPAASNVVEVMQAFADSTPSSPTQQVTINDEVVLVPEKVNLKVVRLLESHPELSPLLLEVLTAASATPYKPHEAGDAPLSGNHTEHSLRFTSYRVQDSIPVKPHDSKQTRTWRPRLKPSRPYSMKPFISEDDEQDRIPVKPYHRERTQTSRPRIKPSRPYGVKPFISEGDEQQDRIPVKPYHWERIVIQSPRLDPSRPYSMKPFIPEDDEQQDRVPVKPYNLERTRTSRPRLNPSRPSAMKPFISEDDEPRRPARNKRPGPKNVGPAGTAVYTSPSPDILKPSATKPFGEQSTDSSEAVSQVHWSPDEGTYTSEMPHPISTNSGPKEGEPWVSENSLSTPEPTVKQVLEISGLDKILLRDKAIPLDILEYLDFLKKNPSLFVPIYKILDRKGVKFPDLREPISHISYKGTRVRLPKTVIAAYTVKINGRSFMLPKDAEKLAKFASENPEELPAVVIAIQQLGGTITPDSTGKLKEFRLFDRTANFPTPITPKIAINGRPFMLPNDIISLVSALKNNPQQFHHTLPLLETYGARPEKSPSGEIKSITINGRRLPIRSVRPARVKLGDRVYNVPADLEKITKRPGSQLVGELMRALQESKVPVVVDQDTGEVLGIERDGVQIPFPVAIQLVLKMGRRKFVIPRDLPSAVRYLELNGLPSDALNVLYDFGVIPVRNADNVVTAIEFNGKQYPVKQQPRASITVAGNYLSLPRDSDKLVRLISDGKVSIGEFLRIIQGAGYCLPPGADGVLRSAHKGFDVIRLPKNIRLMLTINNVDYCIPHNLPRLANLLHTIEDGRVVGKILDSLERLGVDVRRNTDRVTMSFNGKNYEVPLKPRRINGAPYGVGGSEVVVKPRRINGAPYDAWDSEVVVNFNGRWFTLPKDATDLANTVRSKGPSAINLLTKALIANGVQVNLTPSGDDIVSFVLRDKKIPVSGRIGAHGPVVSVARSDPAERNGDNGLKLRITIRGKDFTMPDDFVRLKKVLPNFQYGELIMALNQAGAKVLAHEREFYGMRLKGGTVVNFPLTFSMAVEADGKKFMLPDQLPQLAKTLSSCNWGWRSVRERLADVGVALEYGSQGAPSSIVFQGQSFELHGTPTA